MITPRSSFELWRTQTQLTLLAVETQAVMTMRLIGMAGIWNTTPAETTRMITEKPEAIGRAVMAAWLAAASGQPASRILHAAARPLRKRTRANARRLARRGPTL